MNEEPVKAEADNALFVSDDNEVSVPKCGEKEDIFKPWLCFICDETFENETLVKLHMETHTVILQIDGNMERQNGRHFNIGGKIIQIPHMYHCDECDLMSRYKEVF